jgi:hypothetical protein
MNVVIQVDMMRREGAKRIEIDEVDCGGVRGMIQTMTVVGMILAVAVTGRIQAMMVITMI